MWYFINIIVLLKFVSNALYFVTMYYAHTMKMKIFFCAESKFCLLNHIWRAPFQTVFSFWDAILLVLWICSNGGGNPTGGRGGSGQKYHINVHKCFQICFIWSNILRSRIVDFLLYPKNVHLWPQISADESMNLKIRKKLNFLTLTLSRKDLNNLNWTTDLFQSMFFVKITSLVNFDKLPLLRSHKIL